MQTIDSQPRELPLRCKPLLRLAVKLRLMPREALSDFFVLRRSLLDVFVLVNLAFLTVDIYFAHATNRFRHATEWIPFVFSMLAPLLLWLEAAWRRQNPRAQILGFTVGILAIFVGVAGLALHLESQFFAHRTLKSLVYTAPFVAPLAYAGLGLLLCMNRLIPAARREWTHWVLVLAWWGFVGNFVLVLSDHAQNGFFVVWEWLPVAVCAWGVGVLTVLLVVPKAPRRFVQISFGALVLQMVVGAVGFAWHTIANWPASGSPHFDDFIYGAPVFAPLLLPNLALLAALALWRYESS